SATPWHGPIIGQLPLISHRTYRPSMTGEYSATTSLLIGSMPGAIQTVDLPTHVPTSFIRRAWPSPGVPALMQRSLSSAVQPGGNWTAGASVFLASAAYAAAAMATRPRQARVRDLSFIGTSKNVPAIWRHDAWLAGRRMVSE